MTKPLSTKKPSTAIRPGTQFIRVVWNRTTTAASRKRTMPIQPATVARGRREPRRGDPNPQHPGQSGETAGDLTCSASRSRIRRPTAWAL